MVFDMTAIQKDKEQEIYSNFINSINSDVTRLNYELHVDIFKKFCNQVNLSGLLTIEEPQKHIINYIISLRQRGLASSSISTMINAIYHFYDMNDVALNKKKIKMFIGQSPKKVSDSAYTHSEISRILNVSDMRMKVMVLLMATAGLRIGALPQLRLRNLVKNDSIYKITVYEGYKEEYYTFCTPECASYIDSYFEYRKQNGEKLEKDSFLIRDQFDITDLEQIRNKSKGLTVGSLEGILGTVLLKAGLRSVDHTYKWIRKEVPRAHGFRKFFTTQLVNSKVNPEIREMLLGHKIGLTGCYYRPTKDELYVEYQKAIANLTINEENRLKARLEQKIQIEKSQFEALKADLDTFKNEVLKQRHQGV
jgi:integrase/recombinase XerD